MLNDQKLQAELSVRRQNAWLIIAGLACALFSVLFLRLGDIQLVNGSAFQEQADENRFFRKILPAQRGLILDRYGDPLVWNIQQYFQVSDPKVLFPIISPVTRDDALKLIASGGAEAVVTRPQRLYRFPASISHVVGYVGEVTAEDLQKTPELKPGMVIGKAGIEFQYQNRLQGKEGIVTYEVNALGKKQRQVKVQQPVPGEDLGTTLDPYLSEYVSRQMGDVLGTAIITDATTGKVLALTSKPSFDSNAFSQVSQDPQKEVDRKKQIQQLFLDPRNLFFNRAISGAYPPGSVFKLMTALAGLEDKRIDEKTEVVDAGTLKVGEFEFGNWYFRQYGRVEGAINLSRAISRSNDIYFYKVAEWLGPNELAQFSRMFGFGTRTGIELPAEARGLVPDPDWKEKVKGEKWYLGNTYHFGIGQGDMLTTPVQVAQMTQALANGGLLCPLSVLAENSTDGNVLIGNNPECNQAGVSTDHWNTVLEGMIGACSTGGTAYPFFSYNAVKYDSQRSPEVNFANGAVACKTGTAEFGGEDEKGHRRTHGWITVMATFPELRPGSSVNSATTLSAIARTALSATPSAQAEQATPLKMKTVAQLSDDELHQAWSTKAEQLGFPSKVTITVLIESDEKVPYREGSTDAGPIARKVVDFLRIL